jgi:hypothetical protein
MLKRHIVIGVASLFAGAANAGPVGSLVTGLLSPTQSASAATSPARTQVQMPGLPIVSSLVSGLPVLSALNGGQSSTVALPGLGAGGGLGSIVGITVLKKGPDGSGYGDVLKLDAIPVVGQQLSGVLVTPLLGVKTDGGLIDGGILDGNATANSGAKGLLGFALISGSNTGNGGLIGLGVLNGDATGHGTLLGLAALSGANAGTGGLAGVGVLNRGGLSGNGGRIGLGVLSGHGSGTGSLLGVGLLNVNDGFHVCFSGNCVTPGSLAAMGSSLPVPRLTILPGVVIGDRSVAVVSSNPLLNLGLLTGDNAGNGGLLGIGVLAGNNSGQGSLAGICALCGNNAGKGPLGIALLSGNDSGGALSSTLIPAGLAGVGVLNKNNAGTGGLLGLAALSGNNSGTGTIGAGLITGTSSGNGTAVGAAVLSGNGTGNGGVVGAGILNGVASGNGGTLGAGVLNGSGSANGGTLGAGVLNGAGSANGGTVAVGALNGNRIPSDNNGASGVGGTVSAGVINSPGTVASVTPTPPTTTTGTPINTGNANVPSTLGDLFASNATNDTLCAVVGRDTNGKATQNNALPCNRLKTSRVASN